jgi:hypothetical protein
MSSHCYLDETDETQDVLVFPEIDAVDFKPSPLPPPWNQTEE